VAEPRAFSGVALALRAPLLLLVVTLPQACDTTVVTPVDIERVVVVPSDLTLLEGERESVSAILRDRTGGELGGARVTWTTDDPDVASVTSNGVVDARSPGSTRIRASVGGISGSAAVRVLRGPTLQLSARSVSFDAGPDDPQPKLAEIDVENGGAGALEELQVRAEDSGGATPSWLEAELLATATPTRLRLRADPSGLEPGTHEALVTISASSAQDDAHVEVTVRVRGREPGPACEIGGNSISGDLRIPRNTRCVVSDLHVAGNLRLDAGASLIGSDVRVDGNVDGRDAEELTLTDAWILGNFRFRDGGSVTLRESRVEGDVELMSNVGSIELRDNVMDDDVTLEKNRGGPFHLFRNTIDGDLECKGNDPLPSGSGNVADEKKGQCSGL
jgi:hypothetical protein